jgi:hypothetical protein
MARADILVSLIDDLRRFERHIRLLAATNERHAIQTRAHIADTIAQIDSEDIDRPIRANGSFIDGAAIH